ncbi:MAG TPA: alpha/beta hydrolase, partial [Solirubrobacteraceae bacterium]
GFLDAEPPTRLGAIAAPALILWGDRDELCPRAGQEALAAAIPGARLETYAGTGHAPHWEQAERAAGDVVAFAEAIAREPALSPLPR